MSSGQQLATNLAQVEADVLRAFRDNGVTFGPEGDRPARDVYRNNLGAFIEDWAKANPDRDLWGDQNKAQVHDFVLLDVIPKIAAVLHTLVGTAKGGGTNPVTRGTFAAAAAAVSYSDETEAKCAMVLQQFEYDLQPPPSSMFRTAMCPQVLTAKRRQLAEIANAQ